mgnify:CR=1 FL=1
MSRSLPGSREAVERELHLAQQALATFEDGVANAEEAYLSETSGTGNLVLGWAPFTRDSAAEPRFLLGAAVGLPVPLAARGAAPLPQPLLDGDRIELYTLPFVRSVRCVSETECG